MFDAEPQGHQGGFLARTYCEHQLADHGLVVRLVQASTVFSVKRNASGACTSRNLRTGNEADALHDDRVLQSS